MAEDVCPTLAAMPDKGILHPWQINQALGFGPLPVPDREWRLEPGFEMVRIIGEM